jgi:hypothetical protein
LVGWLGVLESFIRLLFSVLKRDEVTEGWRKLHDEELHNLYYSLNISKLIKSRTMGWTGHVARMWQLRNSYRIFFAKPKGKRQLGKPGRREEDNIKMHLREIWLESVD